MAFVAPIPLLAISTFWIAWSPPLKLTKSLTFLWKPEKLAGGALFIVSFEILVRSSCNCVFDLIMNEIFTRCDNCWGTSWIARSASAWDWLLQKVEFLQRERFHDVTSVQAVSLHCTTPLQAFDSTTVEAWTSPHYIYLTKIQISRSIPVYPLSHITHIHTECWTYPPVTSLGFSSIHTTQARCRDMLMMYARS